MSRVCLTLLRLLLAGWVGAATLFVVVGIREVTSPEFDSSTRDALVLLRFPAYYLYGAGSLVAAGVCCLGARAAKGGGKFVMTLCLVCIGAAGLLMCIDYVWIYRPLTDMLESPARPEGFVAYHEASKWINAVGVGICLCAALLASWPRKGAGAAA